MRRVLLVVSLLALGAPGRGAAVQIQDGGLNEFLRVSVIGGGIASAGVGLAGRWTEPPSPPQSGQIQLSGIPSGATVEHAYLYWATLGNADGAVTFAGTGVSGQQIGTSDDPCWRFPPDPTYESHVARADVTDLVSGNGTYAIAGVGDVGGGTDAQGASLLVVYGDEAADVETTIIINDGSYTGGGFVGQRDLSTSMGLTIPRAPVAATVHTAFADANPPDFPGPHTPPGPMRFNGTQIAPIGFIGATDGMLWDDVTADVPTFLLDPSTELGVTEVRSEDDCIVWIYSALTIEIPGAGPIITGIPDPLPNANGWNNTPVTIHWVVDRGPPVPDTVANTEGTHEYESEPSCDTRGRCTTGKLTLSIDKTGGAASFRAMEFPIVGDALPPAVQIFDQWVSGTADDAGAGIDFVRVEIQAQPGGETQTIDVGREQCQPGQQNCSFLDCNPERSSCEFRFQLPADSVIYSVTATAIDRAGNADPSPPMILSINPFPGDGGPIDGCPGQGINPLCDIFG